MKFSKTLLTLCLFIFCLAFTNCSRDTTSFSSSTEEMLVAHVWSVNYFFSEQDMTAEFNHSQLLFSSTGAVGYQKNGTIIPGTWSRATDASSNELVTIAFNTSDTDISKLNNAWKLTDLTSNSLQFQGTATGAGRVLEIKTGN